MDFSTAPAPHIILATSVRRIMCLVLVMLVPAVIAQVVYYGPGLLVQLLIATGSALGAEAAMLGLRRQPQLPCITDGSAVVTAFLFAFTLPALAPWWLAASGAAFAIVFGKHLFGGLGRNVFNPAMAGYAALLVSFPAQMTHWPTVHLGWADTLTTILTGSPSVLTWDAITAATPLDAVRTGLRLGQTMQETRLNSGLEAPDGRGTWIPLSILAGGIGLIACRIVRWHIPVAMLGTIVVVSGTLAAVDPGTHAGALFHLTSGATLLGAFFIACDPVTAATSDRGRIVFGAGIGVLTIAIRTWGHYPDGVAFAVLIMNLFVPLIDRYTVPRIYGHAR